MAYRVLALPFLTTLVCVLLLAGLGKWQLDRRAWKLGIVERIESRVHGEAVSLIEARDRWEKTRDIDYTRVLLVGRFLHQHERHLYAIVAVSRCEVLHPLQTAEDSACYRGSFPNSSSAGGAQGGHIEGIAD